MSDVVAAIEKVRQVAQAPGKGLSEANTIHKLIMPVLKALGWDVNDIEYEYACKGGGAVDIALMVRGRPRVMVEAKAFSPGASPSAADKNTLQTISYGAAEGVEWCLLTNGGKYELYNTTVSLPLREKLVLAVDVMSGTPDDAAKRLGLLSLENVSNGQLDQDGLRFLVESRLRQWLKDADEELVETISKKLKQKVPEAAVKAGMRVVGGGKVAVTKAPEPRTRRAASSSRPRTLSRTESAGGGKKFKWEAAVSTSGAYTLKAVFLPDPSNTLEVTGVRLPPDADFRPGRSELHAKIAAWIAPLFPGLDENLIRAKAWSGTHRIYPASDYGKSE